MQKRLKALFVDDNLEFLKGLQRNLRSFTDWEIYYLTNAEDTALLLEQEKIDVIFSDFQMPGQNGLELLAGAEIHSPHAIRVLFSGQQQRLTYLHNVNVFHYFFWKPLKIEGLKRFFRMMTHLYYLIEDETLASELNSVSSFPIYPENYELLTRALDRPDCQISQLAYIVRKDMALTLQIFKLASSAGYALDEGLSRVEDAIAYLDINSLRSIVSAQNVITTFDLNDCPEFKFDLLQQHVFTVVKVAEAYLRDCEDKTLVSNALLCCLVHDVGRLILATHFAAKYRQVIKKSKAEGLRFATVEKELFGADHTTIGAYLCALWGLPIAVSDAIMEHSAPAPPVKSDESMISWILWHANQIALGKPEKSGEFLAVIEEDAVLKDFLAKTCSAHRNGGG